MNKVLLLLFWLLAASASFAEESGTATERQTLLGASLMEDSPVVVHGFVSQGYIQTTDNNYLPDSTAGTTDFAEAGINLNKKVSTDLRVGLQLFARDFGRTGNYNAKFDWFLMDYHWRDWLGFRAGRIKIPYGLYNETNDIDIDRVPILLPQSVYPTDQRDYLLAQTGIDIYGYIDLSSAGGLDYRLYRGTLQIDPTSTVGLPFDVANSDVPYVHGARLIWEAPISGLRVAGSYQNLRFNSDLYIPSIPTTVATNLKVTMAVGSIEYTAPRFQISTEYASWWGEFDSNNTALLVPVHVPHQRYYGMFTYRLQEWLQPGVFYSETYPNSQFKIQPKDYTKESALFVRIDMTPNWIVKLEWHYIEGTSSLSPALNSGKTTANMDPFWQLFMAKTTLYF